MTTIVILDAFTDIGTRLAGKLRAVNLPFRLVSRRGETVADLSNGIGVRDAMEGADVVVSCAHARFTQSIIENLPTPTIELILMGSAWRYSAVQNKRADEVRKAKADFMRCNGVMLHSTMICGGTQENNIQRLLGAIHPFPVIPAPGGGHQALGVISLLNKIRATQIDTGIVDRFSENVDILLSQMREMLAVQPREFEVGLRLAIDGWRRQGVMKPF